MSAKPVIELDARNGGFTNAVIWQSTDHDVAIGEPALLVRNYYGGIIGITQGDREILINGETVPELCKLLRKLAREGDPQPNESKKLEPL